jgi:hypothetical protein
MVDLQACSQTSMVRRGTEPASVSGLSAPIVFVTFKPEGVYTSQAHPEPKAVSPVQSFNGRGRLSDVAEMCRANFWRFVLAGDEYGECFVEWLTCCCELGAELVIASKLLVDESGDFAGCDTATVGLHAIPVESVVPTLGGVVEETLVCSYRTSCCHFEGAAVSKKS